MIGLRGLELAVRDDSSDLGSTGVVRCLPRSLGVCVVLGDIDDGDVVEAGLSDELGVRPAGNDLPRAGTNGSTVSDGVEVVGDVDGGEGHATAGSKKPVTGAQHPELRAETAQHVGVHDGIEALAAQRLVPSGREHKARAAPEPILDRPSPSPLQPIEGEVSADDVTPGLPSEVQPRPARARPDVCKSIPGLEIEVPGELVRL